ncbi:MAG TPA: CGNR zinc finger domain-containing protein [Methylocella sp.]|nr:CGNR zinc finger domain-containing protein [Methylocella sp.]
MVRPAKFLDGAASEARALREWLRGFVCGHAGKPLERRALRELAEFNRLLEQDEAYRQIALAPPKGESESGEGLHGALHWQTKRRWRSPNLWLSPIAEAIGDLICQKDFTFMRKCEGAACTLWFFDVSKGHLRRWCSMAMCGNRAKAARYRARARQNS